MQRRPLPYIPAGKEVQRIEMKDGKIRLQSHAEDLGKRLYDMYLRSDQCDVSLVVQEHSFKAHKVILMACSEYFAAMFSHEYAETETNVVSFADNITSVGLGAVLEFAYTGWLPIQGDSVRDILEVARHFLMSDVTKLCEDYLVNTEFEAEKYIWFYEIARDYSLSEMVKDQVVRHTKRMPISWENYISIIEIALFCQNSDLLTLAVGQFTSRLPLEMSDEFIRRIDGDTLISILKRISHGFYTDVALLRFLVKWVDHSSTERSVWLPKILREINLLCFDEAELEAIGDMEHIKCDAKCTEIIITGAKRQLAEAKKDSAGENNPVLVSADTDHLTLWRFQDNGDGMRQVKIPLPTPLFRYGSQPIVSAAEDNLFIFNAFETRAADGKILLHCFSFDPICGRWTEFAPLEVSEDMYCMYNLFRKAEVMSTGQNVCVGLKVRKVCKQFVLFDINKNEWSTIYLPAGEMVEKFLWLAGQIHICCQVFTSGRPTGTRKFMWYDPITNLWFPALKNVVHRDQRRFIVGQSNVLVYSQKNNVGLSWYDQDSDTWLHLDVEDGFEDFLIRDVLSYKDSTIYFIGKLRSPELEEDETSDENEDGASSDQLEQIAQFILSEDRKTWSLGKLNEYPCDLIINGNRPCIIDVPRDAHIFRDNN